MNRILLSRLLPLATPKNVALLHSCKEPTLHLNHVMKASDLIRPKPTTLCHHRNLCSHEEGGEGGKVRKIDPSRDRRIPVELELSIQYLKSDAFKETYQDYKIWELFRRNFLGQFSPAKPRLRCVEDGVVTTSNPCVICRDRYLVVHYKNVDLLNHFISPHTGYVYPNTLICLCLEQYEQLCVAVTLAKNHGLIDFEVPLRQYQYSAHYQQLPQDFVG